MIKRVDKEYKNLDSQTLGNVPFLEDSKQSTLNYFDKLLDTEAIDTVFNSEVEKNHKS